jgi:hypothetical protein
MAEADRARHTGFPTFKEESNWCPFMNSFRGRTGGFEKGEGRPRPADPDFA